MKKMKKKFIIITIVLLAIVLSILALSNQIKASNMIGGVDFGITEMKDCKDVTQFAWFIANYPEKYMQATVKELFNVEGLYYANSSPTKYNNYYTCACMNHLQYDFGTAKMSVVNVVEMETPGKITIYNKSAGENSPVTLDLYDFNKAQEVYRKIKNNSNAVLTEEEHYKMKFNVSMFTYALCQIPKEGAYSSWKPTSTGINSAEDIAKYYWFTKGVQKYVIATGMLDSAFYENCPWGLLATETHKEYEAVVEKILEKPTLKIEETIPTIEYVGQKAYIGPFKVEYSGGTPTIKVGDTEVKYTTKNNDGTFNRESDSSDYVSGTNFYAVLDENIAKDLENIEVKFKLDYESYKAKISFARNYNGKAQGLMYHAGGQSDEGNLEEKWNVEQNKELTIQKVDESGANLNVAGIKFKVYDSKGEVGTLITDENGKTNTLTLIHGKQYTIKELENNIYGYKGCIISGAEIETGEGTITSVSNNEVKVKITKDSTIAIKNDPQLGNIKLEKTDDANSNIKLENVGFIAEISSNIENEYAYLQLKNKDGKIVTSVKGTATISKKNIATADGKEYSVNYYSTNKPISKMTESEKENLMNNITTFITTEDGTLTINNLEVYKSLANKYTYKLIETTNSNYGFKADSQEIANITLEAGKTSNRVLGNSQIYTKISGYVWIENSSGKANQYDGLYTEGETSQDIKLKDLYTIKNGTLVVNPDALTPVEIKLRNKTTQEILKQNPDEFSTEGKYTFNDIEVSELSNYEVVFVYDGFYYTTVVEQLSKENGSKVKEITSERETLNNKFAIVKDNSEVITTDGKTNKVEYNKEGHTSVVSNINFDVSISASTTQTNYNLKEQFDLIKSQATKPMTEIENINMGIVLREQPKISVNSDIYSVLIDFEGYKYNYEYNGRQNYYENKNGDDIGVKFEQEYSTQRYTRPVYASDIQAAKDLNKEIKVYITYKIQIANESRTLKVMPKQIINYFDANYDIKAVGLDMDNQTHTITNSISFSQPQEVQGNSKYKSTIIDFNQLIESGNENVEDLYITFDIQRDAILGLLNNESTYHNATEIKSYATYYGENTSKIEGKQFATEQGNAGKIYAGIDKASQPGNMELVLVDHPSVQGTQILDTTNYEDDTSSAPSLLLQATEQRKISGTIFEDEATNKTNNQKLGDGIFNSQEKTIGKVKVELWKVDDNGNPTEQATYSNGALVVIEETDESGNYTFGYYDEINKKHVGVLPGKYVIKYTYNNESYIIGGKTINVNDYKSTIITSQIVKDAFEQKNEKWYLVKEDNRYSDARDDIYLRPEYNKNIDKDLTTTYSNYNNQISINYMNAYTPIMNIGIEFTLEDTTNAFTFERIVKLENIDFGIVERPDIDISIEKQITSLEILAQNGTAIIPKGDPSDTSTRMQYVKKLDRLVSAEIETKLLQGAKLNLEYTITIVNNSDKDYLEEEYYYYGTGGKTETTSRAKQVVDYLDNTMTLQLEQTENTWVQVTAENLYNDGNGLISKEVYEELKAGKHHILTTNAFEQVGSGEEKSIKLYATKYLATTDDFREENRVEVIELTGLRAIKETIPGDYKPTEAPKTQDESEMDFVITPPTGTTINYAIYIGATIVTFAILVLGIVIIKKRIIKK